MNLKLWLIRRVSKARPRDDGGDWRRVRKAGVASDLVRYGAHSPV